MANTPSTNKRIRQNEVRRDRNRGGRSTLRGAIKQVRAAVEEGNQDLAVTTLARAVSLLDRAAQAGLIHTNAAARSKSRLTRLVAGSSAAA